MTEENKWLLMVGDYERGVYHLCEADSTCYYRYNDAVNAANTHTMQRLARDPMWAQTRWTLPVVAERAQTLPMPIEKYDDIVRNPSQAENRSILFLLPSVTRYEHYVLHNGAIIEEPDPLRWSIEVQKLLSFHTIVGAVTFFDSVNGGDTSDSRSIRLITSFTGVNADPVNATYAPLVYMSALYPHVTGASESTEQLMESSRTMADPIFYSHYASARRGHAEYAARIAQLIAAHPLRNLKAFATELRVLDADLYANGMRITMMGS